VGWECVGTTFPHLLLALHPRFGLKGPETLFSSGVRTFYPSKSSLLTSLVESPLPVLWAQFFMSCEAMKFAGTVHGLEVRSDVPVSLLMVLHAKGVHKGRGLWLKFPLELDISQTLYYLRKGD